MHLGVNCIPFGAAFHLGFGQCPAVGGRGVKHMDLFPNIPFTFFLPFLQEFTFLLMISLLISHFMCFTWKHPCQGQDFPHKTKWL